MIIPFRDRGIDPLRAANLKRVLAHWDSLDADVIVVSDGRVGTAQFNRSAAYNGGVNQTDATTLVFAESDILIDHDQIWAAAQLANTTPGLVVPFTTYHYLRADDSEQVRAHKLEPADATPDYTMDNSSSVGAVNVISRTTLASIGRWDENFEGSWYDDRAMEHAFKICAGPTQFVLGTAYHLYHLPGWTGQHLTVHDKKATQRNQVRYQQYLRANTVQQIKALTRS